MTGRLVAALGRRSRATRGLTIAALALVGLLVVASALALARHRAHRPESPAAGPTRARQRASAARPRPTPPDGLVAAKRVAARFLDGYLPFLYGRGSARSIEAIAPGLRLKLRRMRELVTPVVRQRHPRLISLTAIARSTVVIQATALVADGGVTTYALRILLRSGRGGGGQSRRRRVSVAECRS